MRRILIGMGMLIGMGLFASPSQAQVTNSGFSDPFFLYYGFYLPYQAARASQPQPEDNIRARAANNQIQAQADRSTLYDPQVGFADADLDPSRPFGEKRGRLRLPRTTPTGIVNGNLGGTGPAGYYSRTGNYFPTMKTGRYRNTAATARGVGRFGGGGGGLGGLASPNPSAGLGFPG